MIVQYPYSLFKLTQSEAEYNPDTGLWDEPEPTWEFVSECRDENNTSNKTITVDSEVFVYGALIQLPVGRYEIKNGDRIRVLDQDDNVRLESEVRLYNERQLHTQLWV